ncbi:hypothetical protein NQ318_012391, partial [Aromia moschata]
LLQYNALNQDDVIISKMSDTILAEPGAAASGACVPKRHSRRAKYDGAKLPTPPPDPKEKDVFEYLDSLIPNYSRSTSTFAPVIATDEAFDHLEKLYKLMEQMLELRDQNARLHRKIRDLEHLNNLERMHKELELAGAEKAECPELDRDTAFAETILESILADSSRKDQKKPGAPSRLRPSILRRQRNRSNSGPDKQVTLDANAIVLQEDGCENCDKSAKVSKWTKVKAAFRWEKASVTETKSQDSGIHVPVNVEIARYLRVPSTSDEPGHSPADSGAAGISTPGSLSTTSSTEDFHRTELRTPCEDRRGSSEDETSHHNYIPQSKYEQGYAKLPNKYHHHHRTPWAKMKDIIQTRNSFKKKHRLSAASDDIQIDVELCSDNEDVFEDDPKVRYVPGGSGTVPQCSSDIGTNSNEISPEIVERYQKAVSENGDMKVSRWTMVKKAFITNSRISRSCPASPKDANIDEEIQRNYRQLQKKLSIEFQEKLSEWERLKQNSPGGSNPSSSSCGFVEENRDPNFMKKMEEWQKIKSQPPAKAQLPSELDLPPDFKKKLQEWEKIKKSSAKETSGTKKKLGEVGRWKSLSGHRYETTTAFEYPPLSEDFRKKLEEWKQIKAGGGATSTGDKKPNEKTPSPRLVRKNSSPKHSKKQKGDRELHWYEKELGKIEKEKQRLERERQKFLEREERLSKLRKSITGSTKKDVLIHTPSGFYRFEGISRKFTQKLYEWEKAKGIGPEASTFALLSSSMTPDTRPTIKRHSAPNTPPLTRSKSADSIAISALNLACPLMSQQPSSLSLNDVEELEKECLSDSKSSSMRYLLESQEALDLDEPEAVLVEVEDYEEETAAPLLTYVENHQLPVYQREELKALCEGETVAAPKVRKSESARAQANYNLIEEAVNVLRQLAENEIEVKNLNEFGVKSPQSTENNTKLKDLHESQKQLVTMLAEKLASLQEANLSVTSVISKEIQSQGHMSGILEAVQDISNEIVQLTETMSGNISSRSVENSATTFLIFENIRDIRSKLLELRRHLSYVCASTDLTAPGRKPSGKRKTLVHKTLSNDSRSSRCDTTSDNSRRGSQKDEKRYIKSEIGTSTNGQGAVKKRIKYRQKTLQSRSTPADTDDEEEEEGAKDQRKTNRQHKKLTRSRTTSDSNAEGKSTHEPETREPSDQKVIVPTETNYVNAVANEDHRLPPESPLTLFVKTTRKLFTPIGETSFNDAARCSPNLESPRIFVDPAPSLSEEESKTNQAENATKSIESSSQQENVRSLPPLPQSPVPQRKVLKDISPSIRLMMAKYNQKVSEQDRTSVKSGNSSGSNSPVAWRSPTAERRVKAQMERYQEGLTKMSSQLVGEGREVQKCASIGYLHSAAKHVTLPVRRESSPSAGTTSKPGADRKATESERKPLTLHISSSCPTSSRHSPEARLQKIQKAKEEFLRAAPKSAPVQLTSEEVLKFPARSRLSQISVDSESSYDSSLPGVLMKSASVGMINIDPDAYRQIDPELHGGGYVSLPRNTKNPKTSRFGFASIASKFRKVKMRKGKERDREKEKLNAVSALCRQSLVVDITGSCENDAAAALPPAPAPCNHSSNNSNNNGQSVRRRSDSPSPSTATSKSGTSWLKKSLFRK